MNVHKALEVLEEFKLIIEQDFIANRVDVLELL